MPSYTRLVLAIAHFCCLLCFYGRTRLQVMRSITCWGVLTWREKPSSRLCLSVYLSLCLQVLTNVMESEKQTTETDTSPQRWRSCKLIIDPALTKGLYKVYRFDGQHFNIPVSISAARLLRIMADILARRARVFFHNNDA